MLLAVETSKNNKLINLLAKDKRYVKTKENLLILLDEFIALLGKRVQDYALDIKVSAALFNTYILSLSPSFVLRQLFPYFFFKISLQLYSKHVLMCFAASNRTQ